MTDKPKAKQESCDKHRKGVQKHPVILIVLVLFVIGLSAGAGAFLVNEHPPLSLPDKLPQAHNETHKPDNKTDGEAQSPCKHNWVFVYELKDVAAVSHVVHHEAVYGTKISYETVCNECGETVTGKTREHTDKTGHKNFTTQVPIKNEVIVQEAYDETVIDKPASVKLVHTKDHCSICGEERGV